MWHRPLVRTNTMTNWYSNAIPDYHAFYTRNLSKNTLLFKFPNYFSSCLLLFSQTAPVFLYSGLSTSASLRGSNFHEKRKPPWGPWVPGTCWAVSREFLMLTSLNVSVEINDLLGFSCFYHHERRAFISLPILRITCITLPADVYVLITWTLRTFQPTNWPRLSR